MIPRLHLFELEDQAWFPARIRDFGTDYIHFVEDRVGMHKPVVPLLGDALRRTGCSQVIDLCSGGGGPVLNLARDLAHEGLTVAFMLTDRFPNIVAFERIAEQSGGSVSFSREPVDALHVAVDVIGLRTIFNAFHHFRPAAARAILADAVAAGQPIGVFEVPERRLHTILSMFMTPLFVFLATPFIRPFSLLRLLFTYVLPVVPLYCFWDGLVSQLRAYTDDELLGLTEGLAEGSYRWRAGCARAGSLPVKVTWLIGTPVIDVPPPGPSQKA